MVSVVSFLESQTVIRGFQMPGVRVVPVSKLGTVQEPAVQSAT